MLLFIRDCPANRTTAQSSERPENRQEREALEELLLERLDRGSIDHDDVSRIHWRILGLAAPNRLQIESRCLPLSADRTEQRDSMRVGVFRRAFGKRDRLH